MSRVTGSNDLHLDLEGENVSPRTLDAHASLALATALLDAMLAIGQYEGGTEEAPFFLAFTEMKGASVHFAFNAVPTRSEDTERGTGSFQQAAKRLSVYLRAKEGIPKKLRRPLDQLRQATRSLPSHVVARARLAGQTLVLSEIARSTDVQLIASAETLRALIMRAGGGRPRVTLRMTEQKKAFTADAPKHLLSSNEFHLYREADVSGVFNRDPTAIGTPIVSGVIHDIRLVTPVDRIEAFDRWYQEAGRPWSDVPDIEDELRNRGRH